MASLCSKIKSKSFSPWPVRPTGAGLQLASQPPLLDSPPCPVLLPGWLFSGPQTCQNLRHAQVFTKLSLCMTPSLPCSLSVNWLLTLWSSLTTRLRISPRISPSVPPHSTLLLKAHSWCEPHCTVMCLLVCYLSSPCDSEQHDSRNHVHSVPCDNKH